MEPAAQGLIEVYPHPALLRLMNAKERLAYKTAKVRRYWPLSEPRERKESLLGQWRAIASRLECEIHGVGAALSLPELHAPLWEFKAFEDKLDAVVCAWVGVCFLEKRAEAFGDANSAIWVPEC